MKILVVDDEALLIKGIRFNLMNEGYEVITGSNGQEAVSAVRDQAPDLVVLDVMMPVMDGLTACSKIREFSDVPIIMLTAKTDDMDKLLGFDCGADDYMTKPFSVLELIARVKTNIRRANLYVTNQKGFVIDNNVYKIFYEGNDLGLTLKEFKLLKMLITRAGVTIEREELFREVWGESYMGETRTLDIHISQLRDKITEFGGGDVIVTVRGIGYRFDAK